MLTSQVGTVVPGQRQYVKESYKWKQTLSYSPQKEDSNRMKDSKEELRN